MYIILILFSYHIIILLFSCKSINNYLHMGCVNQKSIISYRDNISLLVLNLLHIYVCTVIHLVVVALAHYPMHFLVFHRGFVLRCGRRKILSPEFV